MVFRPRTALQEAAPRSVCPRSAGRSSTWGHSPALALGAGGSLSWPARGTRCPQRSLFCHSWPLQLLTVRFLLEQQQQQQQNATRVARAGEASAERSVVRPSICLSIPLSVPRGSAGGQQAQQGVLTASFSSPQELAGPGRF